MSNFVSGKQQYMNKYKKDPSFTDVLVLDLTLRTIPRLLKGQNGCEKNVKD